MNKNTKLTSIELKGFKSIDQKGQTIHFGDSITVLIGANGVGKSNLISFFKMLKAMMRGRLGIFVAGQGYADGLLHYGASVTDSLLASVEFQGHYYRFHLSHGAGGELFFEGEEFDLGTHLSTVGTGYPESLMHQEPEKDEAVSVIRSFIDQIHFYQFHDTSNTAKFRNKSYINNNRSLEADAGNLAAFLYAMKEDGTIRKYYDRIVRYIQRVIPQFGDFELEPLRANPKYVILDWRELHTNYLFGAHQLSDGSLRFIALATLLLQPPSTLPGIIVIDEPELGLHPSAMSIFAAMVKIAGQHSQVILSTQSPRMVDEFEVQDIIVVERDESQRHSIFRRLDQETLAEWLADYSLSELWEKNVLGGQP